jgi:hypothetical protein
LPYFRHEALSHSEDLGWFINLEPFLTGRLMPERILPRAPTNSPPQEAYVRQNDVLAVNT